MKASSERFAGYCGMRSLRLLSILSILVVLGFALNSVNSYAQLETGSIQGKVTDSSGAAIPKAAVHVVNESTGVAKEAVTNKVGLYSVQGLFPGNYKVSFVMKGFQRREQHITLLAEQAYELSPSLSVGSSSETVNVSANAIQLANYTNNTISSDLDETRISQIPENGRSVTNLLSQVTPGAIANGGRPEFNGALWRATTLVQDGSTNNDLNYGGTLIPEPDPDSIKEVNVVTNGGDARYTSPTTAIVTTKSGTNELHGSFFETAENSYFGIARDRQDAANFKQAKYIRNEFGGSVGGPIFIPWLDHGKMYDGKNKSFFFFAYERYSLRSGNYQLGEVPTMAERSGDFSNAVDANGVLQVIYDPSTTSATTPWTRTAFPGNKILTPPSPFAKAYYSIAPQPTNNMNPLAGQDNITFAAPNSTTEPNITTRLDHTFNSNNSIYLRYTHIDYNIVSTPVAGVPPTVAGTLADGTTPIPAGVSNLTGTVQPVQTAAIGFTHVISPTFVSQTVVGGTWEAEFYNEPPAGEMTEYEQELGLPNNFGLEGMPIMKGSATYNWAYTQNDWGGGEVITNLNEDLTKTLGRHQLAFGGRYNYSQADVLPDRTSDYVDFDQQATALYDTTSKTSYTALPNTGIGDADVFLGGAADYSVNLEPGNEHWRVQNFAAYFQDDWRISSKLTLDLGMRWEGDPSPREMQGLINGFDLKNHAIVMHNTPQQLIAMGRTTQGIITNLENLGVVFETPSEAGFPQYITHGNWALFDPRVGFAYSPFGAGHGTVLRGGIGRYTDSPQLRSLYSPAKSNAPYAEAYTQSYTSNQQSPDGGANYELRSPLTVVAGQNSSNVVNTTSSTAIQPGLSQVFPDPNDPPNSMYQVNATIEQPLKFNSVLRTSYIYNYANNLDQIYEPNYPMQGYVYEATTGLAAPSGYSALYPYDHHTFGILEDFKPIGWSTYNALQVNYQRLFHKGYGFQVSYVWQKGMRVGGNSVNDSVLENTQDYIPSMVPGDGSLHALNRAQFYEVWSAVPPEVISWNGVIDLPIGRNRRYLRHMNRVLDEVVGGYQVAFNGSAQVNWFQLPSANWGGDNPAGTGSIGKIKKYGHKYPVTSCSGGVCSKGYLYDNAFLSPVLINNPCQSNLNFVTGVPSSYQSYQTPINMDPGNYTCKNGNFTPGITNYLNNDVSVPLANGTSSNVAYSPGPGTNPFAKSYLHGPWNSTTDISLFKVFPIHKSLALRVNVDAFNAFNIQGSSAPGSNGIQTFLSSHNTPRQIQLTARLNF
jgi:hypothetical protein